MARIAHQHPQYTVIPWDKQCARCQTLLRRHLIIDIGDRTNPRYDSSQRYLCPSGIDSLYEALEDWDTFIEQGWEG